MLLWAPKLYFRNHCAYAGLYTFNHYIYPDTCSLKADKEGKEKQSSLGYAIPPVREMFPGPENPHCTGK